MRSDEAELREGEEAIELPPATDAGLVFIGRIRTPWQTRQEAPRNPAESDAVCTVDIDPRFANGLLALETCSHVILLYWLHQARRDLIRQRPRFSEKTIGTFALRSPMRPNPIGLAVADVVNVQGNRLTVRHVDCLDGTPLIDIKPYFARIDSKPDATVGWHTKRETPLPLRG